MDPQLAILVVLFILMALSVISLALVFGVLQLSSRLRNVERVLYKLAGEEIPREGKNTIRTICVLLIAVSTVVGASPREAVAAAWKDIQTVPRPLRKYQRYLTDYHTHDPKSLDVRSRLGDFWVNSLSRRSQLRKMVRVVDGGKVVPGLYRINLFDYDIPLKVWERLAETDPYFHTRVEKIKVPMEIEYETKVSEWEGGYWKNADGTSTYYAKGAFKYEKRVPKKVEVIEERGAGQAVGVDKEAILGLVFQCNSQSPILRLDWFMVETSQQSERQGTGYYDFMEVKTRKDFDKLVALDRKLAEEKEKEVRAIVPFSGVALNNRQIIRLQTINGGYWLTLDVIKQTARKDNEKRNAVRNLDGDFQHDAEEGYGTLSNGLFAFWAGDAKGNRQDSVPDTIASDKPSPGNEARIHPYSCISCHKEGIRPIDDYARRVYKQRLSLDKPDVALTGPDYEKQYKLQRLYLSDLEGKVKLDQTTYATTLYSLTEMKTEELALEWSKLQKGYRESPVGIPEASRELGVTQAKLVESLKVAALSLQRAGGYLDPSYVGLLGDPPLRMRREYFEELFVDGILYANGTIRVPRGE